jgi:HAD superfamily hydrolase (TIGR01509 family)
MSPIKEKPQALIWDMDGVLVATSDLHYQTWAEIYQAYTEDSQALSRSKFDDLFGMRNADTVPHLFGQKQATPEFVAKVSDAKEALFRQKLKGELTPLPGVLPWLAYWQAAGVKQALASSAPSLNIDAILDGLQIRSYFNVIVSGESDSIARSKPAPDVFLEAARQLQVTPASCLVLEDAVVGVQAAKSGGMYCLAVTTTHSRSDLAAADLVVDSLADLPPDELLTLWLTFR